MFIVKYRKIFFSISTLLMLASVFAIYRFGFNLGIDFAGGTVWEVSLNDKPNIDNLRQEIGNVLDSYTIRESGENNIIIKSKDFSEEDKINITSIFENSGNKIVEEIRFSSVGPVIGEELKSKSYMAISMVLICIVLFITFAFRRVSKPVSSWKYGLTTIIALLHDVLIPTGIFVTYSHFTGAEVDLLFVSALLAILGYSVHDTIVVFDRVRENLKDNAELKVTETFESVVGKSVANTMARSINTSLTTFITLLALYLIGGESTRDFAFLLLVGVVIGAYSSIFVASPLLVSIEKLTKSNKMAQ